MEGNGEDYETILLLWKLPDAVLFHIVSFVAPPTHRAAVICHRLALLSRDAASTLLEETSTLWEIISKEDYQVVERDDDPGKKGASRRACKRLRRTVLERVRGAHSKFPSQNIASEIYIPNRMYVFSHLIYLEESIHDNTEIAFFYLTEMTSKGALTKAKLKGLLNEYGPIRVNNVVSSGGLFLVELCRAKQTRESTILACVKELINHGALMDRRSHESDSSQQNALCVATVRGMPTIVKFLLEQGANTEILSSGRFRLRGRKSLLRKNVTPLEFGRAMRAAEAETGASKRDLRLLDACVELLRPMARKTAPA